MLFIHVTSLGDIIVMAGDVQETRVARDIASTFVWRCFASRFRCGAAYVSPLFMLGEGGCGHACAARRAVLMLHSVNRVNGREEELRA